MRAIKCFFLVSLFVTPMLIFSQARANGGGKKDMERDNDFKQHQGDNDSGKGDSGKGSDVPIDGGISLLLAASVGYGIKKVINNKKLKNKPGNIQ